MYSRASVGHLQVILFLVDKCGEYILNHRAFHERTSGLMLEYNSTMVCQPILAAVNYRGEKKILRVAEDVENVRARSTDIISTHERMYALIRRRI